MGMISRLNYIPGGADDDTLFKYVLCAVVYICTDMCYVLHLVNWYLGKSVWAIISKVINGCPRVAFDKDPISVERILGKLLFC